MVLQQTNKLTDLVQRIEKQLQENPQSVKLYEQLIEIYDSTGKTEKSVDLTKKIVELRPKADAWRFRLAEMYSDLEIRMRRARCI